MRTFHNTYKLQIGNQYSSIYVTKQQLDKSSYLKCLIENKNFNDSENIEKYGSIFVQQMQKSWNVKMILEFIEFDDITLETKILDELQSISCICNYDSFSMCHIKNIDSYDYDEINKFKQLRKQNGALMLIQTIF